MKRFTSILLWLLALGLIGWIVLSVPLNETWAAIRQVGIGEWLVLIVMNGLVLLLLNGRWWLILRSLGWTVSFWALFGYRLASFGVSYFTPGPHFGGEPVQVLLLEQEQGVGRETAVASVALDKTIELLINFTFLAGGVLYILQAGLLPNLVGWQTAVWGVLLFGIPAGLLGGLWVGKRPFSTAVSGIKHQVSGIRSPVARGNWPQNVSEHLTRIEKSLIQSEAQMTQVLRQSPKMVWGAFGLSLLSWVGIIFEYGLSLAFLGLDLSLNQVLLLLVAARIAILLPLPAGIGTLESSQILGLSLLGLETAIGLSITLVIRARDVLLGLIGVGWGWYKLRGERRGENFS